MLGLYAIIDVIAVERRGLDPLAYADAILAARPVALQLRDKRGRARETLELLQAIAALDSRVDTLLVANDRPDLAALAGWDGVHLGQHDLPPAAARRVLASLGQPTMRIGMSVHDERELERALAAEPDYIALGPVFATSSKQRLEPVIGVAGLSALAERARARSDRPLVAIGGLDGARAVEVARVVPCLAVIGALLPDADSATPLQDAQRRARSLGQIIAQAATEEA